MFYPSLEKAKALSEGYSVIPISMELMADVKTSIEIVHTLSSKSEDFFILESVANADSWSRYSFLGYMPTIKISGLDGIITFSEKGKKSVQIEDPVEKIRKTLLSHKSPVVKGLPPFTGGFIGYFSYDFVKYTYPAPVLKAKNADGFDDFHLMLIDKVIAFDLFRQKIFLIVNISTDDLEQNYANAIATLKDMERLVLENSQAEESKAHCGEFSALFSKEQFCDRVKILQRHIREGDIF